MNKLIQLLFCFVFSSVQGAITVEQFPFTGSSVIIVGQFASLNVNEGLSGEIDIKFEQPSNGKEAFRVIEEGAITTIELLEKTIYQISVPALTNVSCIPNEVAGVDAWYQEQHNYQITLNNLTGEVVVDSDGYDVRLIDVLGPTSVVTYGDIDAVYNSNPVAEMISLDTYQGSIKVKVPSGHEFTADEIEHIAESNMLITKKGEIKFSNNICTMKLHSEVGSNVYIQTIKEPTHPELMDKLIKLFIRDQGKNGMSTGARAKLNELGYKEYIDSQPDIRPFTGNALAEELVSLIDEYGFPTPEMVGDGYAMKAVAIVLFNSKPQYIQKYETEYVKYFGQQLLDIYYKNNGKSVMPIKPEAPILDPKVPMTPQSPKSPKAPKAPKKKGN